MNLFMKGKLQSIGAYTHTAMQILTCDLLAKQGVLIDYFYLHLCDAGFSFY